MDQTRKVTVLTVNGRRQNVPITPNTTILQILEQVCEKHSFDSDEYGLKHHGKEIDLTQTFRFSGLPNNCLLEMFQTAKKRVQQQVDLCVQLENCERLQKAFLPTVTLLEALQELCPEQVASYENPVVIYMRTEIAGEQLQTSTLKSLGILSGRAMVRLLNKSAEDLKKQANVYIPPAPKEKPKAEEDLAAQKPKPQVATGGFSISKELVSSLKKTAEPEVEEEKEKDDNLETENAQPAKEAPKYDWGTGTGHTIKESDKDEDKIEENPVDEPEEDDPQIIQLGERNAVIFSLESHQKVVDELPESFFELTVKDLKLVLRDLGKTQSGTSDAPLLTTKMREMEESNKVLKKIGQYHHTVLRIQFPDRYVLQGSFKTIEKVADVYEFVRKYLKDPETKFHLFTIPPKNILPLDVTLIESDCVPAVVLHFAADDATTETSFLKDDLLEKLTSVEGALKAARQANTTLERRDSGPDISTGAIRKRPRQDEFRVSNAAGNSSSNIPKWFQAVRK